MSTVYPIILVHGIAVKDFKKFKAFGRIERNLKAQGFCVYTAKTDGFGTIEHNAETLKAEILNILKAEGAEKVNIIAHSKGGLDSKCMITQMDMGGKVASLTTLCTPHKGSKIADNILKLPKFIVKFLAFWINFWYKIFGDKKPDSLTVCKQLKTVTDDDISSVSGIDGVYCQSYSTTLRRSCDDFLMGIPLIFSRKFEGSQSDGLVAPASAKFAEYRGDCIDDSISHSEIIGYSASKKKRKKVYDFYIELCNLLASLGF